MTQTAVDEQIEAIKRVTAEVIKSKESALKFLKDAGIIRDTPSINTNQVTRKKSK